MLFENCFCRWLLWVCLVLRFVCVLWRSVCLLVCVDWNLVLCCLFRWVLEMWFCWIWFRRFFRFFVFWVCVLVVVIVIVVVVKRDLNIGFINNYFVVLIGSLIRFVGMMLLVILIVLIIEDRYLLFSFFYVWFLLFYIYVWVWFRESVISVVWFRLKKLIVIFVFVLLIVFW